MDTIETMNVIRYISNKSSNLLDLYSSDPSDPSILYLSSSFDNHSHFSPFRIVEDDYSFRSPRKNSEGNMKEDMNASFSYLKWPKVLVKYTKKDSRHNKIIPYSTNPYNLLSLKDNALLKEFKIDSKSLKSHFVDQNWASIENFFVPLINHVSPKTSPILSDRDVDLDDHRQDLIEPVPILSSELDKDSQYHCQDSIPPNNFTTLKNGATPEHEDNGNDTILLPVKAIDDSIASYVACIKNAENDSLPIPADTSDVYVKNDSIPISTKTSGVYIKNDATDNNDDENDTVLLPAEASEASFKSGAIETTPGFASINTIIQSLLASTSAGFATTNKDISISLPSSTNSVDIQPLISVITNLVTLSLTNAPLLEKLNALLAKPSLINQLASGENLNSTAHFGMQEDKYFKIEEEEKVKNTMKSENSQLIMTEIGQNSINCKKNDIEMNESDFSFNDIHEDSQKNPMEAITKTLNDDLPKHYFNLTEDNNPSIEHNVSDISSNHPNLRTQTVPQTTFTSPISSDATKDSLLGNITSLLLAHIDLTSPISESSAKKGSNKSELKKSVSFDLSPHRDSDSPPPPPPPPLQTDSKPNAVSKTKKKKGEKQKGKNKKADKKNKKHRKDEKKSMDNNDSGSDSPPPPPPPLVSLSSTIQSHNHLYHQLIAGQHYFPQLDLNNTLNLHNLNNIPIPNIQQAFNIQGGMPPFVNFSVPPFNNIITDPNITYSR
ncbi:unnamed protein product [Gordionus sp. m RMFG-2023]